ncbi:MAG TPA: dihydroxyacetone kinase subunit DhaL [Jiangellaceae bacterium]
MNVELCRAWMVRFAELIDADAGRLTALDAAIGDGDHGVNMQRGMRAAVAALDESPPETPGRVLIATGRALVAKTGGAAGPLYGTAFRRAGKALADTESASAAELGAALVAMLGGIQELGQAAVGDKTMVDALTPAVSAFEAAAGDGLGAAVEAAARAAAEGTAGTVPLQARKGRASYLGERSIGHEDPGAASTALLLRALAEVTAAS